MSGLEALGVACNVIQLISAAIKTASVCRAIYNGDPTASSMLEEDALSVRGAAVLLSNQCQSANLQGSEEKELNDLGRKCQDAAQKLLAEVQSINQLKNKGSLSKTLHAAVKSHLRKSKVEDLEKQLQGYRTSMETHVITRLYQRSDIAQLQQHLALKELSSELQVFISNLASGYTKIDDLLNVRDDVMNETKRAEAAVKDHLSDKLQWLQMKDKSKLQGEKVLKSLKYPEMNQRLNNITPADETTFTGVFRSYEAVTNETHSPDDLAPPIASLAGSDSSISLSDTSSDLFLDTKYIGSVWSGFVNWLRSDDSLFWIQGKPGSGKSTLVKFLVEHPATAALLKSRQPETMILSHFFWKAGTDMQSSLKGLFCSLMHQTLAQIPDQTAMHFVLQSFPNTLWKDTVDDWSLAELQNSFFAIYRNYTPSTCIFLDGLDEISQKEGASRLIAAIYDLTGLGNIKICTASRPEWVFKERLANVLTLKLEDLTRPDMYAFVHKELRHFVEGGSISEDFEATLASNFVSKAHGVFLWLSLALRSVQSGLEKQDCERELALRLEGLPVELEHLYADMWNRLNHDEVIYRKRAAHYLNLVLSRNYEEETDSSAFTIMVAADPDMQDELLNLEKKLDRSVLCQFCKRAKREILTRCVGLLEFIPNIYVGSDPSGLDDLDFALHWDLQFTHRTVYDFLVETEPGQRILGYHEVKIASIHSNSRLIRGHLCLVRALSTWDQPEEFSAFFHAESTYLGSPIRLIHKLRMFSMPHKTEDQNAHSTIEVLEDIKRFYDMGILSFDDRPGWYPAVPFLALVARLSNGIQILEEYVLAAVNRDGPSLATDVLRNVWFLSAGRLSIPLPSPTFIEELLRLGASTCSYGVCFGEPTVGEPWIAAGGSAMAKFLQFCCKVIMPWQGLPNSLWFMEDPEGWISTVVETIVAMAGRHPDLSERVLCFCTDKEDQTFLGERQLHRLTETETTIAVLEVDLAFLLSYLLGQLVSPESLKSPKLSELYERSKNWFASVSYIISKPEHYGYSVFQPRDRNIALRLTLARCFRCERTDREERRIPVQIIRFEKFATDEGFLREGYKWLFEELAKKQMGVVSIEDLKAKRDYT